MKRMMSDEEFLQRIFEMLKKIKSSDSIERIYWIVEHEYVRN